MKSFYAALFTSLLTTPCFSQSITFSKSAYSVNEPIKVTVIGDLVGIESDIKGSYAATQGVVDLYSAPLPGFYRVDFKFKSDVTKSYLIGILPNGETSADEYVIPIDAAAVAVPQNIVQKMFNYFKREPRLLGVTKSATYKFGKENAVDLVLNASFCITTISGQPVVMAICKSLSVSTLKKLGLELMKGYLNDMKAKNYISATEYSTITTAMGLAQIGGILKNNCSLLFKTMKTSVDNPDLKIAIGYMEQQCKTTVVIIDKVKVLQ